MESTLGKQVLGGTIARCGACSWGCKRLGERGLGWGQESMPTFSELLGSAPSVHLLPEVPSQTEVPKRPSAAQTLQHGVEEALGSSRHTAIIPPDLCPGRTSVPSFPRPSPSASSPPQHQFTFLLEEGQENGSHRVPQISEANMTRAEKQCVGSLESQRTVSRSPYVSAGPLTSQQHAARCLP